MPKVDPAIQAHLEWIGFVQPTGLVVSAPALVRAGAILDRRDAAGQRVLRECTEARTFDSHEGPIPWLPDYRTFAERVLDWSFSPKGYAGTEDSPIPPELEIALPEYGETLRPDFAVREPEPLEDGPGWQLLIRVLGPGESFDHVHRGRGGLEASAHGRMERLLRRTGVQAGLLFNGRALRLVSAPRGESSGWLDFRVADMVQTAGRPISTALRLLLSQTRLLSLPRTKRLAALLEGSRKFQNEVSERLAEQVLHALYELLRGFQAAHDASKGELLHEPLTEHPDQVYRALLTVILRLVFLLYAEERDMLPDDETFLRHYSLAGLYERLREDAALHPDTMDQRYGAWAQLQVLFRLIHDGAEAGAMRLPRRHGVLFDPDRFPFLEGRSAGGSRQIHERIEPPLVPDGTIYRALDKLLILDGERISYRALDVEQIGSVYETMMGFRLETATGRSAAIRAAKRHGAPTTIDLDALLGAAPAKRRKWIQDCADRKLTDRVYKFVMEASTIEDLHAALEPVLEKNATPDLVPRGAMILQPSEERRRSGSHYTPRSLTEPIVRTTLEPILSRLRGSDGRPPPPEQILDLKVCDPAMGSGAFLVEACRQLGDTLVEAWHAHGELPEIPADEDEVILARRLVAQRCLYGIDRNPVAVDLAKVSLWLVTLAKDHPFTFLNHALRHGDSLVGLSRRQIEAFHWDPGAARFQAGFEVMRVGTHMKKVAELRAQIREADEGVSDLELRDLWDRARTELDRVRFYGDLVLAAFFEGKKTKERETKRGEFASAVATAEAEHYREWLRALRQADPPLAPLHWDIEFPEVFDGVHSGFDALVGNPPFLGGKNISGTLGLSYLAWIKETFPDAGGQADLVAYFFQRSYRLLCTSGHLGLLATNTIAQGDTRRASLRHLLSRGGHIYSAYRRRKWPGRAAVIVSIVHISKDIAPDLCTLDGKPVERISAFLFHFGPDDDPRRLAENRDISFAGPKVDGPGFTFDDLNSEATPVDVARELIERSPRDSQVIRPMIGGQEMLTHPRQHHRRYVIDFSDMSEAEARRWPHLISILEEKVKSRRLAGRLSRHPWWQFERTRPQMRAATAGLRRVLMHPFTSTNLAFAFVPSTTVVVTPHIVFANESDTLFCALQSRPHEIWARFFGSSMKDDLRYTPSDCFETFPFPENWEIHPALEAAGKECYEFRADLMVRNDEGLTKTYNRFHDPDERDPEILELRGLHAAMDRAVLDAYGWSDILTECQFLLDYEIDEEDWGRRRKPWRYRWPDEVRDEVLARLLELNAARAREEARAGLSKARKAGRKGARKPRRKTSSDGELFS